MAEEICGTTLLTDKNGAMALPLKGRMKAEG
jgi:hypothetical protein